MAKESHIRKKAIEALEDKGWLCWYAPKVKFQQTDVFGIIDLLALRGKSRKSIQLTTLSNVSARRKKILGFMNENDIEMCVEIWAWDNKNKTFKKEKVNGNTQKLHRKA